MDMEERILYLRYHTLMKKNKENTEQEIGNVIMGIVIRPDFVINT